MQQIFLDVEFVRDCMVGAINTVCQEVKLNIETIPC